MQQTSEKPSQRFAGLSSVEKTRGISRRTVYEWARTGLIKAFQPGGGKLLIDLEDLDRFITSHKYEPPNPIDQIVDEVVAEVRGALR